MSGLWVHEAGPEDAPLVVLVHGSMDRSTSFAKVVRRLRDDLRVLSYDRRGYGQSVTVAGPFTMARQVEDLLSVMADRMRCRRWPQLRRGPRPRGGRGSS